MILSTQRTLRSYSSASSSSSCYCRCWMWLLLGMVVVVTFGVTTTTTAFTSNGSNGSTTTRTISTFNYHQNSFTKRKTTTTPKSVLSNKRDNNPFYDQNYHRTIPMNEIRRTGSMLKGSSTEEQQKDVSSITTPFNRPVLAFVDVVTLLLFAGIGKASHTSTESIIQDLQSIFITALPFILSWFVTSPVTGVYKKETTTASTIRNTFVQTVKGWILAIPLGCVGRGLIRGYPPPVPFIVVTMIATLILLSTTRILYTIVEEKIQQQKS